MPQPQDPRNPCCEDLVLPVHRSITIAMAALSLSGCSSWRPLTTPVPEHVASQPQRRLRLTLTNGERVEVDVPRVLLDSVVGVTPDRERARMAIALENIAEAEQRQSDGEKTMVAFLAGVGAVAALLFAAALAASASSGWY